MTATLTHPTTAPAGTAERDALATEVRMGAITMRFEYPGTYGVRITLTGPDGTSAVFGSVGELGSAAHLSGELLTSDMPDDQAVAAMLAGWCRAGADAVREHSSADRAANRAGVSGQTTRREWRRTIRDLWGTAGQAQDCANLAYHVGICAPARVRGEM